MIFSYHNSFCVIGYDNSSMSIDLLEMLKGECGQNVQIIQPEKLLQKPNDFYKNTSFFVGFSQDKQLRRRIIKILEKNNADCGIFIHHLSYVEINKLSEETIKNHIGKGTIVGPMATVSRGSKIGNHCYLDHRAGIAHFCHIGDNVIFHGNSVIGGRVKIGNNCELNMSCNILPKLTICDNVTIGAVSNVTKNITEPGFYAGYRARKTLKMEL